MGSKNELPKNVFYGMELDDEQVAFVEAIRDLSKTIVFCDAPAGTGKTTLAMGAANILVQDKRNELKKVLTRCHDTCKVIVIGHTGQIDINGRSGFAKYMNHFDGHPRCAVCKLTTNHRGWLSTFADKLEE